MSADCGYSGFADCGKWQLATWSARSGNITGYAEMPVSAFVDAFVKADAYYKAGLVTGYTIRPWMIVVGA